MFSASRTDLDFFEVALLPRRVRTPAEEEGALPAESCLPPLGYPFAAVLRRRPVGVADVGRVGVRRVPPLLPDIGVVGAPASFAG